jgi:hypothetical protein
MEKLFFTIAESRMVMSTHKLQIYLLAPFRLFIPRFNVRKDEGDGFIRWPSPLPIFDTTYILVRKCYSAIYDSILQISNMKTRVVVMGVPGIGKSSFALYFAWRYWKENPVKGFLLERSADEIWVFDPRDRFRVSKK